MTTSRSYDKSFWLALLLFAVAIACVIFAFTPCEAKAAPPCVSYSSNEYAVTAVPSCTDSGCVFVISVVQGKNSIMTLENDSPFVEVLDNKCVRINSTGDFLGIGDTEHAFGCWIPQVVCVEGGNIYADRTASRLEKELLIRVADIQSALNPGDLIGTCGKHEPWPSMATFTQIIELKAIEHMFLQEGLMPPALPILGFLDEGCSEGFDNIMRQIFDERLEYRGLGS